MDNVFDIKKDYASELVSELKKRGLKITFAESCTGGLASAGIVDVPGASEIFYGSIVSYDNSIKEACLKVSSETLDKYSTVSHECAREMAEGVRKAIGSDIALSMTGVAGPSGGTSENPVGTVYIGYSDGNICESIKTFTEGDRRTIREITCLKAYDYALRMIRREI